MSNKYPILALLLLTVVCGCEQASNAEKSTPQASVTEKQNDTVDGHQRMVDLLKQIAIQTTEITRESEALPHDATDMDKYRS